MLVFQLHKKLHCIFMPDVPYILCQKKTNELQMQELLSHLRRILCR